MKNRSPETFMAALSAPSPVPPGTRVRLLSMPDDPDPIPEGTEGTVWEGNGTQMHVEWDNGRTLSLLPGVDRWEVVDG